jgi:phytanoyl-CoA hydroxylase
MQLSAQQVEQFRTQGFLIVPKFFSPRETQAIQNEVSRLKHIGKLRNVATAGDGKTHSDKAKNLQLCPMYKHSTLFRALPFDPKVISAVSSLIGDPVVLQLDQVFLKPGGDGAGTSWHQDNAYFKIADPLMGTAMWIAAHDATIANGTLHVIGNQFREELKHDRDPMSDHHIRCWPDESKEVPCIVPAGGVVFFAYGTPHCTKANRTDKERAGVAFHFLREEMIKLSGQKENFSKTDYHPILTGPKASGGLDEYGTQIAGTWDAEVEKAASWKPEQTPVGTNV